jgi:hypothetical protein
MLPFPASQKLQTTPSLSKESPMPARLAQQDNENRRYEVGTARRAVRLRKAKLAQAALSAVTAVTQAPYLQAQSA